MKLKIVTKEKSPRCFEVALDGRLDTQTYGMLESALDRLLEGKPRAIQLDMEKLEYISSIGLGVVLQTMKRMKEIQGKFTVTRLQPQIRKVFDIAKVLPKDTVFSGSREADRYLDAMQRRVRRAPPKDLEP